MWQVAWQHLYGNVFFLPSATTVTNLFGNQEANCGIADIKVDKVLKLFLRGNEINKIIHYLLMHLIVEIVTLRIVPLEPLPT